MNISDVLISLLRSELCGEESPSITEKEFTSELSEKIFTLAEHHDLAHFIREPMKKSGLLEPNSELEKKLQKQQMLAVFRYKRIEHELITLSKLFEDEKIPFIPLKGSVIRKYYSKPWMRTSCDIDILIKETEFERAKNIICSKLGYKAEDTPGYHDISLYSPSGVHLELHFNIKEKMEQIDILLEKAWDYAAPKSEGSCEYVFSPEFFIFHIVAHMSYHFINGGCGIRPFMDMYLVKKNTEYNEAELIKMCDECNLADFYRSVSYLTDSWFSDKQKNALTERMQEYLIYGGVYGTLENKVAVDRTRRGGKSRYALSRIFIPFRSLKLLYPILERHPWLMPVCHIRRWFSIIFGGRLKSSIGEMKANSNISDEKANQTANLLKEIGLI